ncbi:MAG: hypothetical protein PVH54_06485 [Gammaproteobacteria bacterium]|jgi:hypothetical protein
MGNKTICVLGMARSGTSLTSMILNRLGVYFGPEQHLSTPYRFNPKGSWEHLPIREINEKIFSLFGGNWDNPPELLKGWQSLPELDDLRMQAAKILREDFGDASVCGYKCILTCMTLPFWQQIIPDMDYVICLRSPLDVARSLERRDGFSLEKGLLLWLLYTKSAIQNTDGHSVHFIFTDRWISDCENTALRLADFIGVGGYRQQGEIKEIIRTTIDKTLLDSVSWKAVSLTQEVYRSLSEMHNPDVNGIAGSIEQALETIQPQSQQKESWIQRKVGTRWQENSRLAIKELHELCPPEESLILVDQDELGHKESLQRTVLPFLERAEQYWGMPQDETTAIDEFERMRQFGAKFIAFAWPAFWLLDWYPRFNTHLRSRFPCILQNDRLIAFDLHHSFSCAPVETGFSDSHLA